MFEPCETCGETAAFHDCFLCLLWTHDMRNISARKELERLYMEQVKRVPIEPSVNHGSPELAQCGDDVPMSERPMPERLSHLLDMFYRGVITEEHMVSLLRRMAKSTTQPCTAPDCDADGCTEEVVQGQIDEAWEGQVEAGTKLLEMAQRVRELEKVCTGLKLTITELQEENYITDQHLHGANSHVRRLQEGALHTAECRRKDALLIENMRMQAKADKDALKVMTEDRDEYRERAESRARQLDYIRRWSPIPYEVLDSLNEKAATPDEIAVVRAFIAKVMGEGRKEYGPLDLSTDKRTVGQVRAEQRDELLDACFYGLMAGMKEGQG